jgi:hypothetical protein
MLPVREFFPSLNSLNDFPPMTVGMLPFSRLAVKSRTSSDFISKMLPGILPDIEFHDMFKDCKFCSFEISDGIIPEKALLDKSTP